MSQFEILVKNELAIQFSNVSSAAKLLITIIEICAFGGFFVIGSTYFKSCGFNDCFEFWIFESEFRFKRSSNLMIAEYRRMLFNFSLTIAFFEGVFDRAEYFTCINW